NQGDPSARPRRRRGAAASRQDMWDVRYRDGSRSRPVRNGSLAVIEMRNIGRVPIRESDFGRREEFTVRFPGRRVVHFKVETNDEYRRSVQEREPPRPGAGESFTLPALQMARGQGFKLLVLLESPAPGPYEDNARDAVKVDGNLDIKFVRFSRRRRRW